MQRKPASARLQPLPEKRDHPRFRLFGRAFRVRVVQMHGQHLMRVSRSLRIGREIVDLDRLESFAE
ncbi:MAG: hypothetical protein KDA64_08395, partial [Rhodospirillaceae bacterium]|nr:hypothetical protein [Rhodospirillaceae bacterium]